MNTKDNLRSVLASLNKALLGSQLQTVEQLLAGSKLATILSQDGVLIARAERQSHLVQFLCTLAVHNNIEPERAQHWLDIYNAIEGKNISSSFNQLSKNNVLRLTINSIKNKISLSSFALRNVKGSCTMWLDAIDLTLDYKEWESAQKLIEHLDKSNQEIFIWQQITKHITIRHPLYIDHTGYPKVGVDYNKLAQIYSFCAKNLQDSKLDDVTHELKKFQANLLEIGESFDDAIKIWKNLKSKSFISSIDINIARIKCKKGDLLGSIEHLDKSLLKLDGTNEKNQKIAEQLGVEEEKEIDKNKKTTFTIAAAQVALGDLIKVAEKNALNIFLVSGTLLGCIREGTFLSHDKDIDVGILGWENQYALYKALIQSGLFTFNIQFLKGKKTIYLPMRHKQTNIWIDIFVYHPKNNKWLTGVDFFFGYRQTFSFTPFDLVKRKFTNFEAFIPKNYSLNLYENFGQWENPDIGYISHLESPSTDNKGALPFMLTARLTALRAIAKKDPIKIRKILSISEQYEEMKGALPLLLKDHLMNVSHKFDYTAIL